MAAISFITFLSPQRKGALAIVESGSVIRALARITVAKSQGTARRLVDSHGMVS
jgi:hypothetical protein